MIVDEISHESFLPYKFSEIERGFKFLSNLRTDTNSCSRLLFSEIVHNILVCALGHRSTIVWTDPDTECEEEKAIKIVYFCYSPYSRARIVGNSFLFDTDSRGQSSDFLYLCFLRHTTDKHTRIGRERLEISPLTLVAECGKGKGGLTRSAHAGDDGEGILGK